MAVKLQGLNPDAMYKIEEINLMPHTASTLKANGKVLSGDYLMKVGLDVFGVCTDPEPCDIHHGTINIHFFLYDEGAANHLQCLRFFLL